MKRITITLAALFLLSACGDKHLEIARPPADKLVCPDEPGAPAGAGPAGRVTDEQAGEYMKALRQSWQGCRSDVDWLRDWFAKLPK
jgi:hypothetical protein